MITKVYSIKDKLTNFTGPIIFNEEKIAERFFESWCKRKKAEEYTDARYYDLYEIGTFDTEKGTIVGYPEAQLKLIREGNTYDEQRN